MLLRFDKKKGLLAQLIRNENAGKLKRGPKWMCKQSKLLRPYEFQHFNFVLKAAFGLSQYYRILVARFFIYWASRREVPGRSRCRRLQSHCIAGCIAGFEDVREWIQKQLATWACLAGSMHICEHVALFLIANRIYRSTFLFWYVWFWIFFKFCSDLEECTFGHHHVVKSCSISG